MPTIKPTESHGARVELAAAVNRQARKEAPSVTAESTALPSAIAGVVLVRLTSHHDDRGSLTPLFDARHSFCIEPIVHAYSLTIRPGRIKGWGMHRLQTDRYFATRGCLRIVLFDAREDSDSCGQFAKFFFTDATQGLLRIPPGVWHADQNWGDSDAQVINFPTHPYNPDVPDKLRIDPHAGIIPFDWGLRDR